MRVKQEIHAGTVTEVAVYNVRDTIEPRKAKLRPRFQTPEDYQAFKEAEGLKKFVRLINANFTPRSKKGTLTCDDNHECHTYSEMKRVRAVYVRRIRRKYPNAKMVIVMGRAKSNKAKIHLHYIIDGVPEEDIRAFWTWGEIVECVSLRENCIYDGVDHGRDYKGIATYYWKHYTPDQGKNHYYATKNLIHPKPEKPVEVKRNYTVTKPPRAPKGYVLVDAAETPWGYLYFKFVKLETKQKKNL